MGTRCPARAGWRPTRWKGWQRVVEHVHDWYLPRVVLVIDTYPPQYTYLCRGCDAVTHDPKSNKSCPIGHYGAPPEGLLGDQPPAERPPEA